MKTEDTSDCNGLVDLAAVKRVFFQLIDVHRFGDWRIFLDGEDPDEPDFTSYDPENTPPWIIHREDLEAICDLHKQLVKAIGSADIPMEDGEKSEGFLVFVGGCIVSKVILLIHCLLLSYNYYNTRRHVPSASSRGTAERSSVRRSSGACMWTQRRSNASCSLFTCATRSRKNG